MKKTLSIPAVIYMVFFCVSCSDDFINKEAPSAMKLADTIWTYSDQESLDTSIFIPGVNRVHYSIFAHPIWLDFENYEGNTENGVIPVSASINNENFNAGFQTYYGNVIIEIDGSGLFAFTVAYSSYGSPGSSMIQCSVSSLSYEEGGTRSFTIMNTGAGILHWNIDQLPGWISVSPSSGILYPGSIETITAIVNSALITPGQQQSTVIRIKSFNGTASVGIPVTVAAIQIVPQAHIEGIVTDAEFSDETGIMAICTKTPNSLVLFNTGTNDFRTVPLSMSPNCISISEDGHKAVIGYSVSSVSYVDLDIPAITRDYTISCVPFDIVLGANSWCYITSVSGNFVYLVNLELTTGNIINGKNTTNLYEKTIIKKIKGKQVMVGTRLSLSPTGILIFDLSKGKASDTVCYYHTTINRLWNSEDGTRLYCGTGYVYNMPPYDYQFHTGSPSVYGNIVSEYPAISAFDECVATNSIFVISVQYYSSAVSTSIEQFNSLNINKIKTFRMSPVVVSENGINKAYDTMPVYVFVNKNGTKVFALKNLKPTYSKNYWTIEDFSI